MLYKHQLLSWPTLDRVIDRQPLTVSPETSLLDVIALMGQSQVGAVQKPSPSNLNSGSDWGACDRADFLPDEAAFSCVSILENSQVIGLFTQQDIVRLVASGMEFAGVKIENVMSRSPIALTQSDSQDIFSALSLLRQHQLTHLPIVEPSGQLVGIVTPASIVNAIPLHSPQPPLTNTIHEAAEEQPKMAAQEVVDDCSPHLYAQEHASLSSLHLTSSFMSEQAEAQRKRQVAEKELERRIEELTVALSESNRQLQAEIADRQHTQTELQQARVQLRAVWDAVPGMLSWISSDLRYIGVNQHLAATFNLPPEAFAGQEIGFLECSREFVGLVRQFFDSPEEETTQEVTVAVDGNKRSYLIVAQKYDRSSAAVLVGIDISDRKRAEEELRATTSQLTALIKNLQAGILVIDESKRIVLINEACCTMMGVQGAEQALIGANFSEFAALHKNGPTKPEKFVQGISEITAHRQVITNEEFQLADGRTIERDYVPIFIEDNYSEHLWMYRDITQRKQLEEELRNALAKEKELSILKSRFVTMASHEFRTPLSIILSSAELLEHYGHKWTLEKHLVHLHRIQSAVKHMTRLLHNVLIIDASETGNIKFKPAPLDLDKFCRQLVEELQLSEGSGHKIYYSLQEEGMRSSLFLSDGTEIQATNERQLLDEKLLEQILVNVLSNAIKYSPKGSTVQLTLCPKEEQAVFQVRDNGIGIPPEDQNHLFDSFYRATNVGNIPGTGLGLAIVKRCIELHRGYITLESKVGSGTTFTVTLPMNNQPFKEATDEEDSNH